MSFAPLSIGGFAAQGLHPRAPRTVQRSQPGFVGFVDLGSLIQQQLDRVEISTENRFERGIEPESSLTFDV